MSDTSALKRLKRLTKNPTKWSTSQLSTWEGMKSFSSSLPRIDDADVWPYQWSQLTPQEKTPFAQLWLAQFIGSVHFSSASREPHANEVTRQWVTQHRLIRDLYPYWDDVFIENLSRGYVEESFLTNWLRPSPAQRLEHLLHRIWFGSAQEQLDAAAIAADVFTYDDMAQASGRHFVQIFTKLVLEIARHSGATVLQKKSRARFLFASGCCGTTVDTKTGIDTAWLNTGNYLRRRVMDTYEWRKFTERFDLLLNEPELVRIHMLGRLAEATPMNSLGHLSPNSEASRWARRETPNANVKDVTLYDAARLFVPEKAQHWQHAEGLGLSVVEAVSLLEQTVPTVAPVLLPDNLDLDAGTMS